MLSGDAQAFVEKVWASRVHVHHARPEDLAGVLSVDDVDHLLTSTAIRTPALRVARDGEVVPSSQYTRSASLAGVPMTGLVDARKVIDLFDEGATVVLQGLHRYWPAVTTLVRDLELTLGHPCQANAYLTPPGSRGFALHTDSHDVFVLQTAGVKQWEVHDSSGAHEVVMEPGASMYLPTGTGHCANTQETASLHVTLGINQVTWRQVLDRSLRRMLDAGDHDDAVPAGYVHDAQAFTAGLGDRLKALAEQVATADPAAEATTEIERFHTGRATAVRGGLRDRLEVRSLTDDTRLRRRAGSVLLLVRGDERLRLLLGDRELRVPAWLEDPLEHVRAHPELCPADLSRWLDEQSRLVLTRRLVVEGLLEVVV